MSAEETLYILTQTYVIFPDGDVNNTSTINDSMPIILSHGSRSGSHELKIKSGMNMSGCGYTHPTNVSGSFRGADGCLGGYEHEAMSATELTLLAVILVGVFCASVVANVLVFVVFSRRPSSLSISNRFLANLTLCNSLFTFLVMPFAFTSLLQREWEFGSVMCQLTGLAMNVLVSASIFTLAVISLDRYCAVVTPLHYSMRITRRRCTLAIVAIWLAALAVSCPPLIGWNRVEFHVNKMVCTVTWNSASLADRSYTLFLVTFSFLFPLVLMLWAYACIFRAARDNFERTRRSSIIPTIQSDNDPAYQGTPINKRRRSSLVPIIRRLSQTSSRSSSLLLRREEWKTAVTSFLIIFSFMLCWLPYFIVICIQSLAPDLPIHPVMSTISTVAAMFGCACNPMVYVFRNKGTRQDLKVILTRKRSFRQETIQAPRRAGSVRGERTGCGGGGGGGLTQDDVIPHAECQSIQEEGDFPCEDVPQKIVISSPLTRQLPSSDLPT